MNKLCFSALASGLLIMTQLVNASAPSDYDKICQCVDPFNGVRQIPVTIRDFTADHPDFESTTGYERGIVEKNLGSDGRPIYAKEGQYSLTTNGSEAFNKWYRNVPGENTAINKQLEMREVRTGFWEYSDSSFFPIDHEGFGNQGNSHNYHFTLETHLKFFYVAGGTFSFKGDDDLWIFINGKLAIDLGGVHGVEEKTVYLDDMAAELGIEPGNSYSFDLFFAERHLTESNFKFQTTFELQCL
ncbi:fibro-slime domain-containing protein [Pseudomonas sp. HK3]